MECAHFLMGYYSNIPKIKVLINKINEYDSISDKSLIDNLEFMIYIIGAYDYYTKNQESINIIHKILIYDEYNTNNNKYLEDIYDFFYDNIEEILELNIQTKYYLNLVYIRGYKFLYSSKDLDKFFTTYKEKDFTKYIIPYMDGLIKFYSNSYCKLLPFEV